MGACSDCGDDLRAGLGAADTKKEVAKCHQRQRRHPGARGSSNSDVRGSSYSRRARRRYLIEKFGSQSGKTIPCAWCHKRMRTSTKNRPLGTFEVDRFPICGHDGGTYQKDNIVPSCSECNATRCGKAGKKCRGRAPLAKKLKFIAYAMQLGEMDLFGRTPEEYEDRAADVG